MKKLIFLSLLLVFSIGLSAQSMRLATEQQKKEMTATISRVSSSMKTMQCSFVQTKHLSIMNDKLVSKGKMFYKQSSQLRWQYVSPYSYTFIINGNKVMMQSASRRNVIDVKSSRLFKSITKIMMNSVTGRSLSNSSDFKVRMFTCGGEWMAELTPMKKEMKQMFKVIKLYFDVKRAIVSTVEMVEKSGDNTVIRLNNVQINKPVNESYFSVN
jgi:outer membrane lipoprotein carrier protein